MTVHDFLPAAAVPAPSAPQHPAGPVDNAVIDRQRDARAGAGRPAFLQNRPQLFRGLLCHEFCEQPFHCVKAEFFQMKVKALMSDAQIISQLFRVVTPEKMSHCCEHNDFECFDVRAAEFPIKNCKKPFKIIFQHVILLVIREIFLGG
jgi:hypothetical protein